jgi:hypothetical protein
MVFGVIPMKPGSLHAPAYIVVIAGLLFWFAALSILFGSTRPRFNSLLAAILFALLAVVGGWISFFGASNAFGGGVPLVSHAANEWVSRLMFGCGAIICLLCSFYALMRAVRPVA